MCEICVVVALRTRAGPANLPQPAPRPGPATPRVSSALVGRVVLSWLAPTLPRIRYKILPAQCCAEQSGTKLSLHAEKAPHRAISGEQGEFYTAHAARAGVLGEFCTEAAPCGCCWASCVVLWHRPRASWRAMAVSWRCSRALRLGSPGPLTPSRPVGPSR